MLGLVHAAGTAKAAEQLNILANVGPWPVVDHLIGYRGKLWFSNAVKGKNHNSADIWSYDPDTGKLRYERYLHSQDAGAPLIHGGLLYWPFEDGRFSLGWGMIEVTDGKNWAPLLVPTAEIFHLHHLAELNGDLLAVSSAWRAGYQLSKDGGRTWRQIYDHETPKRRVSRFTATASVGGRVYSRLRQAGKSTLTMWSGNGPAREVKGWPQGNPVLAVINHKNTVFAVTRQEGPSSVWRLVGGHAERLPPPQDNWRVMDLTSDGDSLWAVTRTGDQSTVWRSKDDGLSWRITHTLSGGFPWSIRVLQGRVFVGGRGKNGKGILWGPAPSGTSAPPLPAPPALPRQFSAIGEGADWPALGRKLAGVMKDPKAYENHGRGELRNLTFQALRQGAPQGFFARALKEGFPSVQVGTFGGQFKMPADEIGATLLLWGMGLSGHQTVPLALLREPWSKPANSTEKYFAPVLTALWAIAAANQRDRATIDAVMERLALSADPNWLQSQVIGTLTAITDQRFAYDLLAWRRWWREARTTWPP